MKFASLMHRAARADASLQQAPDVVRMATRNGSAALRHDTGSLEGLVPKRPRARRRRRVGDATVGGGAGAS